MSSTQCSELCDLLNSITVNTTESAGNTETTAYGMAESFASNPSTTSLNDSVWLEMAQNWVDIEEDVDVLSE